MYYYAYIDENNVCTGVYSLPAAITDVHYITITEEQYTTQSVVGKEWNAESQTWEEPFIYSCTTDDVDYKGTGTSLTEKLDAMDTAITEKADADHTHTEYAAVDHAHTEYVTAETYTAGMSGKANTDHTHAEYAESSHTHLQNDITGLASALSGKADTSHTHSRDDVTGLSTALSGKVDKVSGKALSTNDYTTAEKNKLAGIAAGANAYTHPASHPATMITGLADVATTGSYNDLLNKPTTMTPKAHTHAQSDVTGLASALSGKANTNHVHAQSDITGLSTALNGKADANHTHSYCTLNQVYPVGSIYLSVNSANPSTLFGGTWVAFGTGKVLMGVKSGGSAEATGGSETATISAHTHTTASHKLTIEEMPPHHHEILNYNENGVTTDTFTKNSVEGLIKKGWTGNVMTSYTGGNQAHSHGNTGSAGAATINVVQPYITCYMWKRTA